MHTSHRGFVTATRAFLPQRRQLHLSSLVLQSHQEGHRHCPWDLPTAGLLAGHCCRRNSPEELLGLVLWDRLGQTKAGEMQKAEQTCWSCSKQE